MKIDPDRRAELREYVDDVRYGLGRLYQLRMNVNYRELPIPSRTALRISRLERDLSKLVRDLEKAWHE